MRMVRRLKHGDSLRSSHDAHDRRNCAPLSGACLMAVLLTISSLAPLQAGQLKAVKGSQQKATTFSVSRLGPIRFGKTTFHKAKKVLGKPKSVDSFEGCGTFMHAHWRRLTVSFVQYTDDSFRAFAASLQRRRLPSGGTIQTRRGLMIGDKVGRLVKLYPKASKGGGWQVIEGNAEERALLARIKKRHVVAMRVGQNC